MRKAISMGEFGQITRLGDGFEEQHRELQVRGPNRAGRYQGEMTCFVTH